MARNTRRMRRRKKISTAALLVGILTIAAVGATAAYIIFWQKDITTVTLNFMGLDAIMVVPSYTGYDAKTPTSALSTCSAYQKSDMVLTDFEYSALLSIDGMALTVGQPIRFYLDGTVIAGFDITAVGYWSAVVDKNGQSIVVFDGADTIPLDVNVNSGVEYLAISYTDTIDRFAYTTPPVLGVEEVTLAHANAMLVVYEFVKVDSVFGSVDFDLSLNIRGDEG